MLTSQIACGRHCFQYPAGLTALVGNMLGDKWQIGANVESDDGSLSNMDMSVNLSRKFLVKRSRGTSNKKSI